MTLSGDKGEYSFEYLPFNRYLLIAFNDKDKDQLFDYPDEDFGIPDRMANVFEGRIPTLNFIMQREETASVSIISAGPTADHLVKARLSRPVKAERLIVNLDKITLSPTDSTMPALNPKSMMENEEDSVSTFDFYFGEIPDGTYRLKIDKSILMARVDSIPFIESAVLKIKSEPDKNPPFILSVSQNGKTVFPDEKIVRFSFSEPIDRKKAGDSLATLAIKDGDTIRTNLKWLDDFKVDLIPDSLKWGKTYIITIHQNSLVDLSGNKAGDSTRIFSFKTFDKDSLGGISGTISYSGDVDSSGLSYLNFMLLGEGKKIVAPVPGKIFNLQLPPGKYLLSGFIDLNGNGKQDQGRLKPLEFSETVSAFPDTVRVRSRFETSGVDFIFK